MKRIEISIHLTIEGLVHVGLEQQELVRGLA